MGFLTVTDAASIPALNTQQQVFVRGGAAADGGRIGDGILLVQGRGEGRGRWGWRLEKGMEGEGRQRAVP
jgi:hypothetical protein